MTEHTKHYVDAGIFLIKEGKVLLLMRSKGTWAEGWYNLPGGHIDPYESITTGVIREAYEEVGVIVDPQSLIFMHVMHRKGDNRESVSFFFKATSWQNEPRIMEPQKHDSVTWFALDSIPHNTLFVHDVLEAATESRFYSQVGW